MEVSQQMRLLVVGTGLAFAALLGLFCWLYAFPVPSVHDEFAYALQADTFASGRLTNPSHPMAEYFRTFYVFFEPTYQAKYPPGQGAFLALGQALFGHPAVGVWISAGLAMAALAGFLSRDFKPWIVICACAVFALSRPLFLHWGWTYWGGHVAFLGGCLLWGSLWRTQGQLSVIRLAALGIGLFILANSRPFEGLLASVAALAWLGWQRLRHNASATRAPLLLALALSGVVIMGWQLLYNWRLTGSILEMPYFHYQIDRDLSVMQGFSGSVRLELPDALRRLQAYFLPMPMVLLLLLVPFSGERRRALTCLALVSAAALISHAVSKSWPHYLAPFAPLVYWLLADGLRTLSRVRVREQAVGAVLTLLLLLGYLGVTSWQFSNLFWRGPSQNWSQARASIEEQLARIPGADLVLVDYAPNHNPHHEWVYNRADIDGAEVVWARFFGWPESRALLSYFADRRFWLLEADARPLKLLQVELAD